MSGGAGGFVPSPALKKVARARSCAGCGGCAAIAPGAVTMERSADHYLRPVQTGAVTPEQDAAIDAICPGLGLSVDPGTRTDDRLWGPYVQIRTGHATDDALRHNASSGGGLSALLIHLLERGDIDGVVQITADPDLPVGNRTIISRTAQDIHDSAGSRYAPSAPLADIAPLLDGPDRFAFVGKPCDVAALRNWSRRDERIDARFPYMMSFFCAGVPSLAGAGAVLKALGVEERDLAAFRYRGDGWPGYATARRHDGTTERMSYHDSWGGILSKHVQYRCKICPDGIGTFADVVCADAWEADADGYPLFDEREGTSLIVSRTEKGEALVRDAVEITRLRVQQFDISTLAGIQPGQTRKRRYLLARLSGALMGLRPIPTYRGFHLAANAKDGGITPNLKTVVGTLRRAVMGQL